MHPESLCCSGTLAASYGQTAYCSQKLQTDPSGWKNDQKSSGSGNPVRHRKQHVSAWKAGNTVFRIYIGETVAIAAQAMTNILENLNGIAAIGVGIGLMTVVGQCLGAGRKDEAVYYIKKLSVLAEIIVVASCLLVFALTIPVTKLGGMEPESARMCFHMISWITVVKPIVWTLAFIPAYGLRAAGDVKFLP